MEAGVKSRLIRSHRIPRFVPCLGGQSEGRRSACTTALDGALEEGQLGQGGGEAVGGDRKRTRKGRGHAEDPEGDGKGGVGRKRGRQGEGD